MPPHPSHIAPAGNAEWLMQAERADTLPATARSGRPLSRWRKSLKEGSGADDLPKHLCRKTDP